MDIETKLQRFSDVVRKEAEEIKNKKVCLIDNRYEESVKTFEEKTRKKYAAMAEDAEISAERQKQKQLAAKNAEEKKALMQKRTAYIDEVFENVLERLNVFFVSPEYEELIISDIEAYKGSAKTAYIMRRDISLKERISERTGVNVVLVDEDFLGGVRISLGNNRIADCTLKRRFDSERAGFNKIRI